jgi:hypothetical protein
MAKLPPERLAKALRANLKRRKQQPPVPAPAGSAKDPEKPKEKPPAATPPSPRQTPGG